MDKENIVVTKSIDFALGIIAFSEILENKRNLLLPINY